MRAKLYLISAMLIFGTIGLFVREINLPSSELALVRGIIGTACLLLFFVSRKQKSSIRNIRSNLWILLYSGAAIGFNWILLFEAYRYTTISNATLSYYFAPVFVIMVSPLLLKEKLTITKLVCIAGSVIGMFLVVGLDGTKAENHLLGIVLGLGAAALYASVVVSNKFLKQISGLESTIIQLFMASIVLLPYVLFTQEIQIFQSGGKTILLAVFVGIVHTGLAYLLYFSSLKELKGQTAAMLSYIDPVTAILLSGFLLNETMGKTQIIGAILILGLTFISEHKKG